MPVYLVTHRAPNGNKTSRPVVARTAAHAHAIRDFELHLVDCEAHGFIVTVEEQPDPDGRYAQDLQDADAARRRAEFLDRR